MSTINGIGGNFNAAQLNGASRPSTPPVNARMDDRGSDRVELSGDVGQYLSILTRGSDVRTDKVAGIKESIANGTYDEDAKLDIALDRLLDDLNA